MARKPNNDGVKPFKHLDTVYHSNGNIEVINASGASHFLLNYSWCIKDGLLQVSNGQGKYIAREQATQEAYQAYLAGIMLS